MPHPTLNQDSSLQLQIKALRDALERASRAATNAESVGTQARIDLQNERQRYNHMHSEFRRLTEELGLALEDNKRLRQAVGDFYKERETLTERIRQLTTPGAIPMTEPALSVVKPAPVAERLEMPEDLPEVELMPAPRAEPANRPLESGLRLHREE